MERGFTGVEGVIDKDLASGLLARDLGADMFIMVTDTPGVYLNYKKAGCQVNQADNPGGTPAEHGPVPGRVHGAKSRGRVCLC